MLLPYFDEMADLTEYSEIGTEDTLPGLVPLVRMRWPRATVCDDAKTIPIARRIVECSCCREPLETERLCGFCGTDNTRKDG